ARVGEAARENGVVLAQRLGSRRVVEDLPAARRLADDPAAAMEERFRARLRSLGEELEMPRVVPPVVVVQPAEKAAARPRAARGARVARAAPLVRAGGDGGFTEPGPRSVPLPAAVVDDDRPPALLGLQR